MASVPELLSIFETAEELSEAEAALDQLATMELPPDLELGECYDSLAEVAADLASEEGLDPSTGGARSRFAAFLGSRDEVARRPPGSVQLRGIGRAAQHSLCDVAPPVRSAAPGVEAQPRRAQTA